MGTQKPSFQFESRKPAVAKRCASPMFIIAPDVHSEMLLAHACETLASASVMASDLCLYPQWAEMQFVIGYSTYDFVGRVVGQSVAG